MRVLLFGTYDTSMHPRVATMAEGLRAAGVEVAECNAPLGLDTAARVDMLASPRRAPPFLARLARRWDAGPDRARGCPPRTWCWSAISATSTCTWPGCSSAGSPVVLDHLVGASDTGRDRQPGRRPAPGPAADDRRRRAAGRRHHRGRHRGAPGRPAAPVPGAGGGGAGRRTGRVARGGPPGRSERWPGPLRVVFYGLYTPLQGAPVIGAALARIAGEPIRSP